ncbi:hypothetical protein WHR41_03317 [Cladosporium halotolerans]|uniref:Myb-like domain-containing protein n=1 Tax=Cladosporium halotolerans TaxID=1052096 RepID=A0AB34KVS5_9PEZI
MPSVALGAKHQDLLRAYVEVSKTEKPDWSAIATKADFPTAKYARDQYTIVKNKLVATPNGQPIDLSERQVALLKSTVEVMKATTNWEEVARVANFKTSKYARDQWTIVRNKLIATGNNATGESPSPIKSPAKGTPGKRKRSAASDNEADAVSPAETPVKKPKKDKKSSKAKVKQEPEVEPSDEQDASGDILAACLPEIDPTTN